MECEEEWMRQEEECARCEEEIHELRRKESRQQEQMSMAIQAAMAGLMAYWGSKKPPTDGNNSNNPL